MSLFTYVADLYAWCYCFLYPRNNQFLTEWWKVLLAGAQHFTQQMGCVFEIHTLSVRIHIFSEYITNLSREQAQGWHFPPKPQHHGCSLDPSLSPVLTDHKVSDRTGAIHGLPRSPLLYDYLALPSQCFPDITAIYESQYSLSLLA